MPIKELVYNSLKRAGAGRTMVMKKLVAEEKKTKKNTKGTGLLGFLSGLVRTLKGIYFTFKKEKLPNLIIFALCIFLVSGTLIVTFEKTTKNGMFEQLVDGLWWTIVTMTTTGYGDKYPVTGWGRILAVVIMLLGIVVTSILSGTIASIFVDKKIKEGRGLQEIKMKSHTIICGWNKNAEAILEGICKVSTKKKVMVVLINELDPESFQILTTQHPGIDLKFVRGDFSNEVILARAAINEAKVAIVLADTSGNHTLDNADERTILTVLAIKSLNPDIHTSAELTDKDKEQHLKRANVDEIFINGEFNGFLFASATYSKGISRLVREMLSFKSRNQIKLEQVPTHFIGKKFIELLDYYVKNKKGIIIGLLSEEKNISFDDLVSDDTSAIDNFIKRKFAEAEIDLGQEGGKEEQLVLNPDPDRIITENDAVFLIGNNELADNTV
jgi:voltage-gated potassium channel